MNELFIQERFRNELSKFPDPLEFALSFYPRISYEIELAKTTEEANHLRALIGMANEYVDQKLPSILDDRHKKFAIMHPGEVAYIEASAKAGKLWDANPNKQRSGVRKDSSENFQGYSVTDVGFKGHKDAMTCTRVGELDKQDRQLYYDEKLQNESHATLYGAERVWKLLHPREFDFDIKGMYRIIYADPPWSYGNLRLGETTEQGHHYPLMTIEQICEMKVDQHILDDAVLFLWATSPILEDAFRVIKAWGFEYKSSFIWDKVKHNMGHYNSVRHEFLLICTRGSCQPDVMKLFDSVQVFERTKHSEKPEGFRRIINTLYPNGNRMELFSRRKMKGWDCYGRQIP